MLTITDIDRIAVTERYEPKPNGKTHASPIFSPARQPAIATAAALRRREFPAIGYVVPGYIAEGCTLLAGAPKLGKSWLMLEVGLAVASGGACLGNQNCDQGDVLYLALEDNERRLQSRIDKIMGILAKDWPASFQYATEWRRANEGGVDDIRDWIVAADNPRLVVVDVLAMFKPTRGDRESLYEADYNSIKSLQALAGEYGVAIVIVHHTRKSGSDTDPFEKISGTLGLTGAADSALVLSRDGHGVTLYARGRDIQEVEAAVTFNRDTCRWRIDGNAADVRRTDERTIILDTLREATEPMKPGEVADATTMTALNVRQLLFKMAKAGEVEKFKGRYIHPERYDLKADKPDNTDNEITFGGHDG